MADTAVAKKLQTSRKGKKAWRKNIDIASVEEGLESNREEERVRGKVTDADELFTIDTTGDTTVRRQLAKDRPLRVDEILNERSAVAGVTTRVRKPAQEKVVSKYTKQHVDKIAKRKTQQDPSPLPKKKSKRSTTASYDMWGDEPAKAPADENPYLDVVKERKVNAPATLKRKPTAAVHQPAVVVPHAGASYNPTMEDHQELLRQAHQVELQKESEARKLEEQLSYRKELDAMAHELEQSLEDEDDEAEAESDKDETVTAQSKEAKRKTRVQRNKEKRLRLEQLVHRQKQHEKEIRKQIDQLHHIEAQVKEHQEKLRLMNEKRQEIRDQNEKQGAKRLGKHFVQERSIDVQLQDELSESLRQLKPEGSLLHDQLYSLQKRNIVEPRVAVKPFQKYKPKVYERRSYKNWDAKHSK
ncbi:tumor suppressor protein Gltscr2 [Lichtheimia hyalospora FSU 10163]|nr:tumor suppressor protein Gltscr2 [Lichtheimia hyalospora FSU 10163]